MVTLAIRDVDDVVTAYGHGVGAESGQHLVEVSDASLSVGRALRLAHPDSAGLTWTLGVWGVLADDAAAIAERAAVAAARAHVAEVSGVLGFLRSTEIDPVKLDADLRAVAAYRALANPTAGQTAAVVAPLIDVVADLIRFVLQR